MGQFAAQAIEKDSKPVTCRLGAIASEKFDPDDCRMLIALLEQRRWSDIGRLLKNAGIGIDYKTIAGHGRGSCICSDGIIGKGAGNG